jgi:uncharacterized membrane protein HdeD (DUF308 family)
MLSGILKNELVIAGVGILAVVLAGLMIVFPLFGAIFSGFIIGIILLIIGIEMISVGIGGRETRLTQPRFKR